MASSGGPGWRVGSLSGIPVFLGRSWLLVALVVVLTFSRSVGYAVAAGYALFLLLSVLVHEAAHALVAQRVGFTVRRIVADFWGGHTAYEAPGATPGRSALVAVVGPLANGLVALLGWWALHATQSAYLPLPVLLLLNAVTFANAFVAAFNLVPGLPLDGGYLLEAAVWALTGRRHTGTVVAAWGGRLTAVAIVLWALWPVLTTGQRLDLTGIVWPLLIAFFIWQGSGAALAQARARRATHERTGGRPQLVRDALVPAGVVPVDQPLSRVVPDAAVPVWIGTDPAGRPVGYLDPDAYGAVPADRRETTPFGAVVRALPPGAVVRATPEDDLSAVARAVLDHGAPLVVVVDDGGHVLGVVPPGRIDLSSLPRS